MFMILLFLNGLILFGVVLVFTSPSNDLNRHGNSADRSFFRNAVVCTTLLFCLQCFVMTELLSLFQQLRTVPLALFYLFDTAVFGRLVFAQRRRLSPIVRQIRETRVDPFVMRWLLAAVLLILLPMLCYIFMFPPTTWDAMTYHLPRVEHWLQNHNIAHYPTMVIRQLFVQPFPEYLISHIFLLSPNDSWAGLVQWFGLVNSLVLVSLIAQQFRLNARGQTLAVLFALSIPMAVCQASGTQVDLVTSFFLLAICYFGISLIKPFDEHRLFRCVFLGISLGLGALTKASIALFAAPFCLWFAIAYFRCFPLRQWLKYAGVVVAIFLLINGPYFYRNFSLCGHLFGDPMLQSYLKNEPVTVRYTLSNIMKTTASQMAVPDHSTNFALQNAVESMHKRLGWDANDRSTTLGHERFSVMFVCCETWVSAFPILIFLAVTVVIFLLRIVRCVGNTNRTITPKKSAKGIKKTSAKVNQRKNVSEKLVLDETTQPLQNDNDATLLRFAGIYLLCLMAGFVFFNAILKWQPWSGRLLVPWYMSVTPFVAFAFSTKKNDLFKSLLCFCCITIALSIMVLNIARSQILFSLGIAWSTEKENADDPEFPIRLPDNLREISPMAAISDKHAASWDAFRDDWSFYYFRERGDIMLDHIVLHEYIKRGNYRNIGLAFEPMNAPHDRDPWEYPIFRLLKKDKQPHRIEHVHYPDYMRETPNYDPDFVPDVIISALHDIAPLEQNYELAEPIPCGYLRLYRVIAVKNRRP